MHDLHDLALPLNADSILQKCRTYVLDDSKFSVYSLEGVEGKDVQSKCTKAEESYARQVLRWPKGRIAKPIIFDTPSTASKDVDACVQHFIYHLDHVIDKPPHEEHKDLAVYPFAFVIFGRANYADKATVVVALESEDGKWRLCPCRMPIDVDLGQQLDSLRMGDIATQDLVTRYGDYMPSLTTTIATSETPSPEYWTFALFSTGLEGALPLPAWIDPQTDRVHPIRASVDLIGHPQTSKYQMKWEDAKSLFPVACRNTKKPNGLKMHRHVFICCDSDNPQKNGLLVVKMEWDGNTDRSDEALEAIGRRSNCTETRVRLSQCLAKARELAAS